MKTTFVLLIASLSLLGGGVATSAGANAVVASASGGYSFSGTVGTLQVEVHPFAFNVQVYADGSVHGRYNYTRYFNGAELSLRGPITCAVIVGNQGWFGGLVEDSSNPTLIGQDMWFQVQDHGEPGSDETPDMSTTIGVGGPGTAQQYCDDAPLVRFPFFLTQGNLQVRP